MIHPVGVATYYSKGYLSNRNQQVSFAGKTDVAKKLKSVQQLVKNSNFDEVQSKKICAELESMESKIKGFLEKDNVQQKAYEELKQENEKLKQQLAQKENNSASNKSFLESYVEFKDSYDLGQIYSP